MVQCVSMLGLASVVLIVSFIGIETQSNQGSDGSGAWFTRRRQLEQSCDGGNLPVVETVWEFCGYLLAVLYLFLCLAIVCDDYFVPALEEMANAQHLHLSMDVAGATLMAAGGSAPELFTNLFGTFQQSEVGIGTIVGSAVFNVLFVIGACCFVTAASPGTSEQKDREVVTVSIGNGDESGPDNTKLGGITTAVITLPPPPLQCTPWPIVRDCICYSIGLLVLAWSITDGDITLRDATLMFALYLIYVLIMGYNERIQLWYAAKRGASGKNSSHGMDEINDLELVAQSSSHESDASIESTTAYTKTASSAVPTLNNRYVQAPMAEGPSTREETAMPHPVPIKTNGMETREGLLHEDDVGTGNEIGGDDENDQDIFDFLPPPSVDFKSPSAWKQVVVPFSQWVLLFPLKGALVLTIPTPDSVTRVRHLGCLIRNQHYTCYVQFACSIVWIGVFAYYVVFCTEVLGRALGIPSVVMGLTFVAAGSSVPDLVSSIIVARQGEADMAISSSIGSNIFDILVGLPLPWIIYMICSGGNGTIAIESKGVWVSIPLLLMTVVLAVLCMYLQQWQLTKLLGTLMFGFYAVFLTVTVWLESPFDAACR